ncbi:probable N-acetyltransferase HLS1-like isoform X4 [Lathyrus oleraceus]|uniref:probable N-acetyltransferase HLS1-like isoform X4 n=1 Tax=Pisum sativum TaxID=3888 RepID=UPI0021CF7201|nr:probable N-acetyltransferase HLS1-like isoform X4 [Pisum sativum]
MPNHSSCRLVCSTSLLFATFYFVQAHIKHLSISFYFNMEFHKFRIRSYEGQSDRAQVENLERKCEVGPSESVFLFTDTMGDPICRIRNSPMYMMLVAELDNELVGVIQGSIKVVTVQGHPPKDLAKVGYVLGLRVSQNHRRKGIGSSLVTTLEEWFISNDVDYAYMATEKENHASTNLFINKFHYTKFRTPSILVNPVNHHSFKFSSNIEISRLKIEQAESLYRRFMGSTEFFPNDIGNILKNKLSLGTWMAYYKDDINIGPNGQIPKSWAMLSVWNSGKLVRALCQFVHNMAKENKDEKVKIIVTEVGGRDELNHHIPHWKLLSCPEDLWCIKALKNEGLSINTFHELTKTSPTRALFVDPREV